MIPFIKTRELDPEDVIINSNKHTINNNIMGRTNDESTNNKNINININNFKIYSTGMQKANPNSLFNNVKLNISSDNKKLNIIQLPLRKIKIDCGRKKIFKLGSSRNNDNSRSVSKSKIVLSQGNRPIRISPQPKSNLILKKFGTTRSKFKNYPALKIPGGNNTNVNSTNTTVTNNATINHINNFAGNENSNYNYNNNSYNIKKMMKKSSSQNAMKKKVAQNYLSTTPNILAYKASKSPNYLRNYLAAANSAQNVLGVKQNESANNVRISKQSYYY